MGRSWRIIQDVPNLSLSNVSSHEHRVSDIDPGMEDGIFPFRRDSIRFGLLAVVHHHDNFPAQMLFVKSERLRAITTKVEIRMEFHGLTFLSRFRRYEHLKYSARFHFQRRLRSPPAGDGRPDPI